MVLIFTYEIAVSLAPIHERWKHLEQRKMQTTMAGWAIEMEICSQGSVGLTYEAEVQLQQAERKSHKQMILLRVSCCELLSTL
jgi:hypothetical protein